MQMKICRDFMTQIHMLEDLKNLKEHSTADWLLRTGPLLW